MQNLAQPTLLLKPFAENGQRNEIPTNPTGTNRASLAEGFPPVTGQNPKDGGIPPTRLDFNGLGHLTTTYDYFYQAGGCFTFNQAVSDAIGGYPLNARLWYLNENGETYVLRSTKANNTDNFLINPSVIGDSWVYDVATTSYVNSRINEIRTNCITEIPQDIKLELNNGTLTLAQGCKGYMGDGTVITTTGTPTIKNNGDAQMFLHITSGGSGLYAGYMTGGTVSERPSSPISYASYYNTSTQKCEYYNGSSWFEVSLPIAIVTRGADGFTSIDQVFNGFGYIGSTVFALPGVKCLIPDGRNSDGSLKNFKAEISTVKVSANTGSARDIFVIDKYNNINRIPSSAYRFDIENNKFINISDGADRFFCICGTTTGDITSFHPKAPFRAVDYNDAVLNYGDQDIGGNKNFTGTLKAPTPSSAKDNSTNVATTAWTNNFLNNKKTEIAGWGMPNYDAGISISSGSDVDIVANGYVAYKLNATGGGGSTLTISIGGTDVYSMHVDYNNIASGGIPVAKGSTFKATVSNGIATLTFFPCIGG